MILLAVLGVIFLVWFLCLLILLLCSQFPQPLPSSDGLPKLDSRVKKNLLLVIAHPDDESMFFAPTLLALAHIGCYNVRILCFSNGNAEGLGKVRMQELVSACTIFQVPKENIEILDHPDLQDGHKVVWNLDLISEELKRLISLHKIEMLVTFDSYGISGHPNHIAVHRGVCSYLLSCVKGQETENRVEAWCLESMSIKCKYFGPISALYAMWRYRNSRNIHCFANRKPRQGIKAMSRHASQWIWYRRLFVIFSCYTYMNTLLRLDS